MSRLHSLIAIGGLFSASTFAAMCPAPDGFMQLEEPLPWSKQTASPVTLVNLWAVWCPPCLRELPALDSLATSPHYAIDTIHLGDNPDGIKDRFEELAIQHLPQTIEPDFNLLHNWGFQGLPATMIVINDHVEYGYPGYIRIGTEELDQWLTCLAKDNNQE